MGHDDFEEEMPLSFGVSATTGYPLPSVDISSVSAMEANERGLVSVLTKGAIRPDGVKFGIVEEVSDPNDLELAGWGVIFGREIDPAVKEALKPLLDMRKQQSGELFKIFEGGDAPAINESATKWLTRHKASLDTVDPLHGVPFYLLIVGDPESIAYEFQYTLDIYWAVGRLAFATADEYRRYAESVVAYETMPEPPGSKRIALFATEHEFDKATQLFAEKVARVLASSSSPRGPIGRAHKFALQTLIGEGDSPGQPATRESLRGLLRGDFEGGIPAVLLTGSHGMEFETTEEQRRAQGAILCQDWDGYGSIKRSHWFEAADLPAETSLTGLVHFFFACYSAGYPRFDNYARLNDAPRKISDNARIAPLPQAMLSHPSGAALASIGHVDRAWAYSFLSERNRGQAQGFRNVISKIVSGSRIGYATDQFNIRWAALSTDLIEMLNDRRNDVDVSDVMLANRWIARDDARNFIILGDPAVRLRVEDLQGGLD